MTRITQADVQNASKFTHDDGYVRGEALVLEFARLREAHDVRVTELLDANSRFEQRAREAERTVETLENAMRQMAFQLGDLGRERDAVKSRIEELEHCAWNSAWRAALESATS